MAVGWSKDGDVNNQIADSIADEILRVRSCIPTGKSAVFCVECGEKIPVKRRKAVPGVQYCIVCQEQIDRLNRPVSLYNRKGSKDSQLR